MDGIFLRIPKRRRTIEEVEKAVKILTNKKLPKSDTILTIIITTKRLFV